MKNVLVAAVLAVWPVVTMTQKGSSFPYPVYDNGGFPDLVTDAGRVVSSLDVVTRTFSSSSCELVEGSIAAAGVRRLLRFDVAVVNGGNRNLAIGNPASTKNPYASLFEFSPCHGHYHLEGFTDYQLLNTDGSVAAVGHKQAFCLMDVVRYSTLPSSGYTCSNQGISSGWADLYSKSLSGQWVDITDVPNGDYVLRVQVNAAGTFFENQNLYSNVFQTGIHLPFPTSTK